MCILGTGWANTEYRSYTFKSATDPTLVETDQSRQRRSGHGLDKEEKSNLARTATHESQQNGYHKAKAIQAKV